MSTRNTDEGPRADEGRGPDGEPMLVLGEQRPHVEDLTAEQLQREREKAQEELDRIRAEAQTKLEQERTAAQAQLREEEERAAATLARQQAELDEANSALKRSRRSLQQRRQAMRGQARTPQPRTEPRVTTPLASSRTAQVLAAVAALMMVLATLFAGRALVDRGQLAAFTMAEQANAHYTRAEMLVNEEVSLLLQGQEVPLEDGAPRSTGEIEAAKALHQDRSEHWEATLQTRYEQTLAPGTPTVVRLAAWQDVGDRLGTGQASYVRDTLLRDALSVHPVAPVLAGVGLLALAGLMWQAGMRRRLWPLLLTTAALSLGFAVLGGTMQSPAESARVQAYDDAGMQTYQAVSRVHDDLEAGFGLEVEDEYYWDSGYYNEQLDGAAAQADYVRLRAELGELQLSGAPDEELYPATTELAQVGGALVGERLDAQLEAAQAVVEGAGSSDRPRWLVTASVGSIVLTGLALAISLVDRGSRRRRAKEDR